METETIERREQQTNLNKYVQNLYSKKNIKNIELETSTKMYENGLKLVKLIKAVTYKNDVVKRQIVGAIRENNKRQWVWTIRTNEPDLVKKNEHKLPCKIKDIAIVV